MNKTKDWNLRHAIRQKKILYLLLGSNKAYPLQLIKLFLLRYRWLCYNGCYKITTERRKGFSWKYISIKGRLGFCFNQITPINVEYSWRRLTVVVGSFSSGQLECVKKLSELLEETTGNIIFVCLHIYHTHTFI